MLTKSVRTRIRDEVEAREYTNALYRALQDQLRDSPEGVELPAPEAIVDQGDSEDLDDGAPYVVYDDRISHSVGPTWSLDKLLGELGLQTRQAAQARRARGSLLGLRTADGAVVYPVSQFRRVGHSVEVKPGQRAMLRELKNEDPWAVAVLMRTKAPELDGQTPLEWERSGGDIEALTALAATVRREWNHA